MSRAPHDRLLPGNTEPPMRPIETAPAGDAVTFRQVLTVLRRRYQLILALTLVGATLGLFLASREPPSYRASAMLRMAGERRELTGDQVEGADLGRTADPLLSIIELQNAIFAAGMNSDEVMQIVVERAATEAGLDELQRLVEDEAPQQVVVGHPLTLRGERGDQAHETEQFAKKLRERLEVPVLLFDERFTTDLAQQAPAPDAPLDARAAAHLLSSYLAWSSAAPA